jgi:hypothetical protein
VVFEIKTEKCQISVDIQLDICDITYIKQTTPANNKGKTMKKKTEYKELLAPAGALTTPVTRLGLARIAKKARAEGRLVKKITTGYIVEGVTGEIREFAKREIRILTCIG